MHMKGSVKEMSKYYVKGAKIKKTGHSGWFTVDEVCQLLNNYDEVLCECEKEFRKYDGRKLFDLDYIVYASILNKINEVLK